MGSGCRHSVAPESRLPRVTLDTQLGEIVIEIEVERAPVTAANFLEYVDAGLYDGGRFHRSVTLANQPDNDVLIEVVQAGRRRGSQGFTPIALERTGETGLRHLDGTISMARAGPDSATSDFFICVGDQPSLDQGGRRNEDGQGFAAFGRVVSGMDVVRRIQGSAKQGQSLTPAVEILGARRVRR